MMRKSPSILLGLGLICGFLDPSLQAADRKLVLIAGRPSHGPLDHEFRAGCLLLQKCLTGYPGLKVEVHTNGWINTPTALDDADAALIYADGGGGHPAIQGDHKAALARFIERGGNLGCAHYGVEIPATNGGPELQKWIGGYYEHAFSVNPMWKPEYQSFPHHPVTRGVKPFSVTDEWYFNMRFAPDAKGLTPILVAKPSDAVRNGPYVYPPGPYPHIQEAKGRDETMMWTLERPNGGRGFGFTGGHRHLNWGNDQYRKVFLNALVWLAKLEVPQGGVESKVTEEDLMQNQDPKGKPKPPVQITKPAAK